MRNLGLRRSTVDLGLYFRALKYVLSHFKSVLVTKFKGREKWGGGGESDNLNRAAII